MKTPYSTISVKIINIDNKKLVGIEIELPNAPPLIILRGDKGFVMCGYLDIKVADKLGLVAARVTGVRSISEMLEKEIVEVTSRASEHGILPGMKVKDIISKL